MMNEFDEEYETILSSFSNNNEDEKSDDVGEVEDIDGTIEEDVLIDECVDFVISLESDNRKHKKRTKKVSVPKSVSELDEEERKNIAKLYADNDEVEVPVCCTLKCNRIFCKTLALKHRNDFQELSKAEQDLLLLSKIQSSHRIPGLDDEYVSRTLRKYPRVASQPGLKQLNMAYFFANLIVCRKFFFFIHPVGEDRFSNLIKHFESNGATPRVHKLTGISPVRDNVSSPEEVTAVITFIKNYADKFAIPLPGRLPNCKNYHSILKLPSAESKCSIFRKYCESMQQISGARAVKLATFTNIWRRYVPFIVIMKPADDLCDVCRLNVIKIQRSIAKPDGHYAENISTAMQHLEHAKKQRLYYNEWREIVNQVQCSELIVFFSVQGKIELLSFDFAEQVKFPSHPQQVGPIYFKTPRKCGIFGIHNERTRIQTNYLIDESDAIGKGPNCIISMLDNYLSNVDAEIVVLFADNCRGQNKNNMVLQYLLWRVLTGKNKEIEYNFMLAGHTKFSPDRSFGILKRKYGLSDVDCLDDLVDCVNRSSPNHFNIAKPTVNPDTNEKAVPWLDWQSYLKPFFKKFPGLSNYHHFVFAADGNMYVRLFAGLSAERQWYLYEQIRTFCDDDTKKDKVAPLPNVPKPKTKLTHENEIEKTPVVKRNRQLEKTELGKKENTPAVKKERKPRKTTAKKDFDPNQPPAKRRQKPKLKLNSIEFEEAVDEIIVFD